MRYFVLSAAYHQGLVWIPFGGLIRICKGMNLEVGGVAEADGEDSSSWASTHSTIDNFVLEGETMRFSKFYTGLDSELASYELTRRPDGLYVGTWRRPGAELAVDRGGEAHARVAELDLDIPLEDMIGVQDEETDSMPVGASLHAALLMGEMMSTHEK